MGRWRRRLGRPLRGGASGAGPDSRRRAALLLFGPRPLLGGKAARVRHRGWERERPRGGARGVAAGPFVSSPAQEACGAFRPPRPRRDRRPGGRREEARPRRSEPAAAPEAAPEAAPGPLLAAPVHCGFVRRCHFVRESAFRRRRGTEGNVPSAARGGHLTARVSLCSRQAV